MNLLLICGMLAAGEYAASFVTEMSAAWSAVALLAVLVALFGHGFSVRGWLPVVVFLAGFALFLQGSVAEERLYRERPWMRGRVRQMQQSTVQSSEALRTTRRDFSRRIAIGLEHEHETVSLCRAILLGERSRLSKRTKQLFVESGTMHVFAISGLHVMAVAKVLSVLLGLLFIPLRWRGLVAIPCLWAYIALIGFPPSAVRAAVMATFKYLAPLFWRKDDGIRAWELTFLFIHVLNPLLIVNVGNALSFAVMLAIVLAGECAKDLSKLRQTLLVTVITWAAGVPIAAHVFGRVTPGGMLANLVLIATAKLAVVSGTIGLLASSVSDTLAAHFNNFGALAIRAMTLVAEGVTQLPGTNFETGRWPLSTCFCWYAVLSLAILALLARAARREMP